MISSVCYGSCVLLSDVLLSVAASHHQRVIQEEPSNGEKAGTLLDCLGHYPL